MGIYTIESATDNQQRSWEIHYYSIESDGTLALADPTYNASPITATVSLKSITTTINAIYILRESTSKGYQLDAYAPDSWNNFINYADEFLPHSSPSIASRSSEDADFVYVSGKTSDGQGTISGYKITYHPKVDYIENIRTVDWSPIDIEMDGSGNFLYASGSGNNGKGVFLASWQLSDWGTFTQTDQSTVDATMKYVASTVSDDYIYVLASDDSGIPYIWFCEVKNGKFTLHGSTQLPDIGDFKIRALCIGGQHYLYVASQDYGIYSYKVDMQAWKLIPVGEPCTVPAEFLQFKGTPPFAFGGPLASALEIKSDGSLSLMKQTTLKRRVVGVY